MKQQTDQARYIHKITKGLWILPQRKRAIEQEIIDHLEDAAEEHQIDLWTTDLLHTHFGPPKKMRSLFAKGAIPWWARFLKWGIRSIGAIFFLLILADLYFLFLYPIDPSLIALVKSKNPRFEKYQYGKFDIPQVSMQWMEPGDQRAQELLENMRKCTKIIGNHHESIRKAEKDYLNEIRKQLVADGIIGATKTRLIREYLSEMDKDMGMMGSMSMATMSIHDPTEAERLFLFSYRDEAFEIPKLPYRQFETLYELWTDIKPTDNLRIPKPIVTDEELHKGLTAIRDMRSHKPPSPNDQLPNWMSTAITMSNMGTGLTDTEMLRRAKEYHAAREPVTNFTSVLQDIIANLPEGPMTEGWTIRMEGANELTDEKINKLLSSSCVWIQLWCDAIQPNPEPSMEFSLLRGSGKMIANYSMIVIDEMEDLNIYKDALINFTNIDYSKYMPTAEFVQIQKPQFSFSSVADRLVIQLSLQSFFRIQCDLLQWIIPNRWDFYYRYDVLKRRYWLYLASFVESDFNDALMKAKQALAKSLLVFHTWANDGNDPMKFNIRAYHLAAPFHQNGPIVEISENRFSFQSAGPDRVFDSEIYNPTNGISSQGDIVWEIRK